MDSRTGAKGVEGAGNKAERRGRGREGLGEAFCWRGWVDPGGMEEEF